MSEDVVIVFKKKNSQKSNGIRIFTEEATRGVLKNFAKLTRKHQCKEGLRSPTSLKNRLWHRRFLVNFAKFSRTPFSRTPLDDCFNRYSKLSKYMDFLPRFRVETGTFFHRLSWNTTDLIYYLSYISAKKKGVLFSRFEASLVTSQTILLF